MSEDDEQDEDEEGEGEVEHGGVKKERIQGS